MFGEIHVNGVLKKVEVKADESGPTVVRLCRMGIEMEFDDLIAEAIGPEALKMLPGLRNGSIEKAIFPIDAVKCEARLKGPATSVTIGVVTGKKATCTGAKEKEGSEVPPVVRLEFEFLFSREAWIFLGENVAAYVEVAFKEVQLQLLGGGRNDNNAEEVA